MRKIFKPKQGPTFTEGRLRHVAFSMFMVTGGGILGMVISRDVYSGIAWGWGLASTIGFLWELSTPVLSRWFDWEHGFGDVVDFAAYQVGALIIGLPTVLLM